MAGFVQIIEYTTSRFDEVLALGKEYGAHDSGSLARRVTVTANRDKPGSYLTIVEFDSYESAMENSNRPETAQFAEQMMKLTDGQPNFYNLDVKDAFTPG
jgi:alpha-acetolactate decarboxylase